MAVEAGRRRFPAPMDSVEAPDAKQVPGEKAVRAAIRRAAAEAARGLDRERPPSRETLERTGQAVLDRLELPRGFLGFAMVAVNNAFWQAAYHAVPFDRRLLLLPKCLSDTAACAAEIDSAGLHCAGCGSCSIHTLQPRAEALGYRVVVSEGTSSVLMRILDGDADALLGVACLDSLEKSFVRGVDLGIPQVAVPLLTDGCVDTEAEMDEVLAFLLTHSRSPAPLPRSYVPLLRESVRLFTQPALSELLSPYLDPAGLREVPPAGVGDRGGVAPLTATDAIALDWLKKGGKRLRPFVTLAAYAAACHGTAALSHARGLLPLSVRRVALAIEALHKASLVHDDIEDDDAYRYGEETLHRTHGTGPALNVGDFLIGLGYRLVAGEAAELGAECVGAIVGALSAAHLELCRGQGAELLWKSRNGQALHPRDALEIYALKTAPAFEVALLAGLRSAGMADAPPALKRFCVYLGEGYQILNDLEDWERDGRNKVTLGQDALAGRPTLLRAFAVEAGGADRLHRLAAEGRDPARLVEDVRALYDATGAFDSAERLLQRLRERALGLAAEVEPAPVGELLAFLVRVILRKQERA